MRAAVTAVLAATAALTPARGSGCRLAREHVVPRFGISTAHTQGMRNHHGYAMQVDTIGLDKLAGANVKVRCLGCKTRKLGRPRHRSQNRRQYENLHWLVDSSDYIEVDVSRSGSVGRWLSLGLRRVHHPRNGSSCFKLPESGRGYECLLKLKSGCLQGATTHTGCPTGTPVPHVDPIAGLPSPYEHRLWSHGAREQHDGDLHVLERFRQRLPVQAR